MRTIVTILMLLAVGVCPEQQFNDINDCPFPVDPNKIVIDPVSGRRLCLGWGTCLVGERMVLDVNWCDPDEGDQAVSMWFTTEPNFPAALRVEGQNVEISFTIYDPNVYYGTVQALNAPLYAPIADRRGTFIIQVQRPNQPPTIGCGGLRKP